MARPTRTDDARISIFGRLMLTLLLCGFIEETLSFSVQTRTASCRSRGGQQVEFFSDPRRSSAVSATHGLEDVETEAGKSSFGSFDYMAHWYPVVWAQDLMPLKPTKVTLFDVDYVVAKLSDQEVVALVDACPHKGASLSEGRVTASNFIQCAYHGWSFNGTDGNCVEIPQVVASIGLTATNDGKVNKQQTMDAMMGGDRACSTAIPTMISAEGMVWLFPGGNLEKALLAPPPPTVPESLSKGYIVTTSIRDFPVDYSLLLENILDADHGVFAHGLGGFDFYSATRDTPQRITEEFPHNGKGWKLTSRVDAVEKLLKYDKNQRAKQNNKDSPKKNTKEEKTKISTVTFTAPSHVMMGRRDADTDETSFITTFWVCPVGTGRSRFMSATLVKAPFRIIPRWLSHIFLNNFVDQDTYLLATQQKYVLSAERKAMKERENDKDASTKKLNLRKKLFAYRSPAERVQARLGTFLDETLSRAPNRASTLLELNLIDTPPREIVLDREQQHLKICPDSQQVVKNCKITKHLSVAVSLILGVTKLWLSFWVPKSSVLVNHFHKWVTPNRLGWTVGLCGIAFWLAQKIQREFYFKYTEALRDRDLKNIPKLWLDK